MFALAGVALFGAALIVAPWPTLLGLSAVYLLSRVRALLGDRERMPSAAIYHPDAPNLFESFEEYESWYLKRGPMSNVQRPMSDVQRPTPKALKKVSQGGRVSCATPG